MTLHNCRQINAQSSTVFMKQLKSDYTRKSFNAIWEYKSSSHIELTITYHGNLLPAQSQLRLIYLFNTAFHSSFTY